MRTSLTATLLSKIAFVTLLFSGFIASAKAAPLDGMALRIAAVDQFRQACGENLCEVTLTISDSIRGPVLSLVEVEVFAIDGKTATSRGQQKLEIGASFEVEGNWYTVDANARKIVATNAPALPAVASTR